MTGHDGQGRGPSDEQHDRTDTDEQVEDEQRERYRELLEELRTIIPGAEVLLGFLLTAPFSNRFEEVDTTGKAIAVGALVAAGTATVLFLAPSAYHRAAEHADRGERIQFGVRSQVGGLVLTALAICASTFVVVRFLFGWVAAGLVGAFFAAAAVLWWWVAPRRHERRGVRGGGARSPRR